MDATNLPLPDYVAERGHGWQPTTDPTLWKSPNGKLYRLTGDDMRPFQELNEEGDDDATNQKAI